MAQEYLPEGATTLTTWKLADNTAGTGWASGATLNIDALGAQSIQGASLNQGATAAIATFTIGPLFSGTIGNGTSPMLFEATTGFYNAATGGTIYWGSKSSGGDPDATTNYTHTGASTMNITEGTVTTLEQAAGFVNVGTSAIVTNHKQSGGVTEYTAGSTAITSLIMTGGRCICHRQITAFTTA